MSSFGKMEGIMRHVCVTIPKRYVYQRKDERGFTLIEALLNFSLFCMISFSLPFVMKGFFIIKHELVPPRYYEWNLFSESIRKELREADAVVVMPQQISFVVEGETILYEKYNQSIRRRVNNRGHEIVLQEVSQFTFSSINQGVHMELEFAGGEKVEGDFFYPSAVDGYTSP
ncbi:competence type IV pilus minor pilin ComGF [Bacillus sp. AFS015802]|uniref:competence type IV pilus minor pilin ComGF n=1 Tax=Bacillus sp. AFS015802 TaxID=2033486 RepID=UPI0015CF3A34|nr:competence type IV pilus minor pilin ComGF [Bacillus sp. AFS015802]